MMRTIEDIIADTLKVTELSLREAFDAGRASAAADLKLKLTTFVSELVAPFDIPASSAPSENQPTIEHSVEHHTEEQVVGEHTAEHNEGGEHHQDGHYN